jgi:hypothetical protein
MSTNFVHYKSGDIFGIIYTFDKAGEGIRMHMHDEDHEHNTTVLKGSILLYGPNGDFKRTVVAGQIFDFDSSLPHEIAALEDNTIIINTFLHGMPEYYADLTPEEKQGILDLVLTHKIQDIGQPVPVMVH